MRSSVNKEYTLSNVSELKESIKGLIGLPLKIAVKNRGRELSLDGTIIGAFERVFLFEYRINNACFKNSYAYSDILTGALVIIND